MCKIDHGDVDALPCALCRACHPELNQAVVVKAERPKRRRHKPERMILTVKEEADRRWRTWLPLERSDNNRRPTRRQFERIVREERGMV